MKKTARILSALLVLVLLLTGCQTTPATPTTTTPTTPNPPQKLYNYDPDRPLPQKIEKFVAHDAAEGNLVLDNTQKSERIISEKTTDYINYCLDQAVDYGTGTNADLESIGIDVCGKTGTAQNPHGKDHSTFLSFAPKDNPRIAISVYVENAGFGATFGVPIGTLMMEMYLKGEISAEHKAMEDRMINSKTFVYHGDKK